MLDEDWLLAVLAELPASSLLWLLTFLLLCCCCLCFCLWALLYQASISEEKSSAKSVGSSAFSFSSLEGRFREPLPLAVELRGESVALDSLPSPPEAAAADGGSPLLLAAAAAPSTDLRLLALLLRYLLLYLYASDISKGLELSR